VNSSWIVLELNSLSPLGVFASQRSSLEGAGRRHGREYIRLLITDELTIAPWNPLSNNLSVLGKTTPSVVGDLAYHHPSQTENPANHPKFAVRTSPLDIYFLLFQNPQLSRSSSSERYGRLHSPLGATTTQGA
jgi:hypothetical protein